MFNLHNTNIQNSIMSITQHSSSSFSTTWCIVIAIIVLINEKMQGKKERKE